MQSHDSGSNSLSLLLVAEVEAGLRPCSRYSGTYSMDMPSKCGVAGLISLIFKSPRSEEMKAKIGDEGDRRERRKTEGRSEEV
jgi:hypothetical protein